MGADRDLDENRSVHLQVADMLVQAIHEASVLTAGQGRPERLSQQSHDLVRDTLAQYGGPCSQAYADVLHAYIGAPPGGRDALFLAVAARAVGGLSDPNPQDQADLDAYRRPAAVAVQPRPSSSQQDRG